MQCIVFIFFFFDGFRYGRSFHSDFSCGFINDIDGFIRLEPVRNVSSGQFHRQFQGFIRDFCLVECFISVSQTFQNKKRILRSRFSYFYRLKTPFKRSILFDIFFIFLQGCSTDAVKFSPCQSRFHNIGSIHGAFSCSGPNQSMQFINEQNPVAVLFDFFYDFFEPVFKFTSVLGPGYYGRHIQRNNMRILQNFRHIMINNPLCQPFCNSCFSHAGFPDQYRVIFISPGKNLDYTIDFILSSDHWIYFSQLCLLIQINGKICQFSQIFTSAFLAFFSHKAIKCSFQFFLGNAESLKELHGQTAAFTQNRQQEMFGSYIGTAELIGLLYSHFHNSFGTGCNIRLRIPKRRTPRILLQDFFHCLCCYAQCIQNFASRCIFFMSNPQQKMFCSDIFTAQF